MALAETLVTATPTAWCLTRTSFPREIGVGYLWRKEGFTNYTIRAIKGGLVISEVLLNQGYCPGVLFLAGTYEWVGKNDRVRSNMDIGNTYSCI